MELLTQEDISSAVGPHDTDYLKSNKGKEQWFCGSEKVEHGRRKETPCVWSVKVKPG